MKAVEFYMTTDNSEQRLIGKVLLIEGKVVFRDLPGKLIAELREGIRGKGNFVYPNDGIRFLEVLKFAYSGSRLRASDVIDV